MPTIAQYGTNSVLTGFVVDYKNFEYIAELVAPVAECQEGQFYYYELGISDNFDIYETIASADSAVSEAKARRTQRSFEVKDYAHSEFLPTRVRAAADVLGIPDVDLITQRVTEVVRRKQELDAAAVLFAAGSYTGMTSSPGTKWGTATVKEIVADVNTALDAMVAPSGADRKIMAMGRQAWRSLSTNANILAAITPTKAQGQATKEQIAEFCGLDEVVVGMARKNSATKVASDTLTMADIWGDNALVCYRSSNPSQMGATGHAVTFRTPVQGSAINVYVYDDPDRGAHGGTKIKVALTQSLPKIVNAKAGYLLTAISA